MDGVLLSIIIPVYKAEKYLDECISSIVSEKSKRIELILIDDGSPDKCPQLCEEWVKKDKRIKCIHQKNSGPSVARNKGIKLAMGKYITFIDSDDLLFDNSLEKVIAYLSDTNNFFDICFMNINKFYNVSEVLDNSDIIYQKSVKGKSKQEVVKYLSSRPRFPGSPCSKLYLRKFLIDNNIYFPEDNRLAEDLGFVIDCILYAKRFDSLDFMYYLYRQQAEATRSNVISDRVITGVELFIQESIDKLCINKKPKDKNSKYLLSFVAYELQILMYFYSKSHKMNLVFLKDKKWILKYSRNCKGRIISILTLIFGLRLSSKIVSIIKG